MAVTFTVGGLSMINALAGAFSEDLAVICITGGPNSNDWCAHTGSGAALFFSFC